MGGEAGVLRARDEADEEFATEVMKVMEAAVVQERRI